MDYAEIETRYTYHPPKENQTEKYEAIRSEAKKLWLLINEFAPDSREKSESSTCLENAVMWANAAIARRS